jgi:hypothetical protein
MGVEYHAQWLARYVRDVHPVYPKVAETKMREPLAFSETK